jgi:hypothetical protein
MVHAIGVVIATVIGSSVHAHEDFPIAGTYTENQVCKGDGSDSSVPRVKITARNIHSTFGLCTILDSKRDGNTFAVHVECTDPGGSQLLGDVTFILRDDKTIDFSDQDKTYKAVLHKCPG